jgi:pSer/pThr/pTyr-binding forkhead associated (FHA) protein
MSGPVILALRVLLAAGLYIFLVWALLMLWREIKHQAAVIATRQIPAVSLSILQSGSPSELRHFKSPEVTIGRHPACECRVNDDSVSAYHARLNFHHGQWWLEDLKSTNGTTLNQEKVLLPTVVVSGDEIRCGETRLIVTLAGNITIPPAQRTDAHDTQ